MKLRIKNGRAVVRAETTAQDVVKRIEGILSRVKDLVYRVKVEPGKRPAVYVKMALKSRGFDSTWYSGSWSTPSAKNFARSSKTHDHLPDIIRSTLFNLFTILPATVLKDAPIYAVRIETWDKQGKPEHVSMMGKLYRDKEGAVRQGYEETAPDVSQQHPYHGYGENPTMNSPELMAPPPGLYEDKQHGSFTLVKKSGGLALVLDADQNYLVIRPKDKDWWDGPTKNLGAIGREKALRAFDKIKG